MGTRRRRFALALATLVAVAAGLLWCLGPGMPGPTDAPDAAPRALPRPPVEPSPPLPADPQPEALAEGLAIAGRVVDENDRPLAGVAVAVLENTVLEGTPPRLLLATDEQGRFRATGLPDGYYEVCASAPGRRCREWPGWENLIVEAGTKSILLHMIPVPSAPQIRCGVLEFHVVRDEDGTEVTRAWISRNCTSYDRTRDDLRITRVRVLPTDPERRERESRESRAAVYREEFRGGEHSLWIEAGRDLVPENPVEVVVPAGKTRRIEIRLVRGGRLTAAALSPLGEPQPGVSIHLLGDVSEAPVLGVRIEDERWAIGPISPGRYRLTASHPAWLPVTREVQLTAGETTEVTLRLRVGGTVRVRVTDAEGRPVAKALVKLRTDGRDLLANTEPYEREHRRRKALGHGESFTAFYRRAIQTDEQGEIVRKYVEPGGYEVVVREPGVGKGSVTATVREGQETTVELVLR